MRSLKQICASLGYLSVILVAACGHHDSHGFDPAANPFNQIEQAKPLAQSAHKKILVIAGGAWCHWCRALDNFIHTDSDLNNGFSRAFVTVKVYSGDERDNKQFFETLPEAPGVPHFWVLDDHGHLLKTQGTGDFETGRDQYDKIKLLKFIQEWQQK